MGHEQRIQRGRGGVTINRLAGGLVATAAFLSHGEGFAMGFRLPNQDPDALARGNAIAATADKLSAIYYNPAGITQLRGQQIQAGLYVVRLGIEHESASGVVTQNESEVQIVPHLYY